jgi:hypothetical protein
MAILNLITASYSGKLGQTVGAKWKDKHTLRALSKPTDLNSPAQQHVRSYFRDISKFLSLFTVELRTLTSLSTRGMTVRNAIIKVNKALFDDDTFDPATLIINKGGLPSIAGFTLTAPAGLASLDINWTASTSPIVSAKAKVVVVVVDKDHDFAVVSTALQSAGTLSIAAAVPPSATLHGYIYLMDKRGSTKVGGASVHEAATSPAA